MANTPPTRQHPLRTVIVFLIITALLYLLMALNHTWTPKLGLDLRGGTTITLTAANTNGNGDVDEASLQQARTIIQQRVDSVGVGESSVTTSGKNQIIVAVPNVAPDKLNEMVGTTAQLVFRPVLYQQQVEPVAQASASPSGASTPGASTPAGTASASPSDASAPAATPTANRRPAPQLPLAPRPTSGGTLLPTDQAVNYQMTERDQMDFLAYQCGQEFPSVLDQVLIACNREGTVKYLMGPVLIKGDQLKSATAGVPQGQVAPEVNLEFNDEAGKAFQQATKLIGAKQSPQNAFGIVLDNKVIEVASVDGSKYPEGIAGGRAAISGNMTAASANDLANILKYGALPLAFTLSEQNTVSPTLGGEQLRAGIIAGIIGLLLVAIYAFIYYHGLALLTVGSLIFAGGITYALMVLLGQSIGFALSLPGIAGAIVAIGVTADSFIIYFERIRDEAREGRSIRTAIELGWVNSRKTIVVADSVSLLSAVVLYALAIGSVKGFAFTLGLTTLIDLWIVFFFTHPVMSLLGKTKFYGEGHRGSGFEPEHLGLDRQRPVRRRTAATKEA